MIAFDVNAAGAGRFVDLTSGEHSEFTFAADGTYVATAEFIDDALTSDSSRNDPVEPTDDTLLAILPDDEYDGLFTNLDGSLLDELLSV